MLSRILSEITVILGVSVVLSAILSTFGALSGHLILLPMMLAGGVLIMGILLYLVRRVESQDEVPSEKPLP